MATRAIRNLTHVAGSHLDLPAQDHPQLVTEDGLETDEATFFGTRDSAAQPEVVESVSDVGEEELETAAFGIEEDNEVLPDYTADPERLPLLSIADSLVASYSLTQSRIHHINHLLPHIFSHPPIPSHSRPRARLPPRSTFQFPTPPPPVHPLPNPEYHGPTASSSSTASGSTKPPSDDPSGQAVKAGPSKGKAKEKENQPPAHEIDCIARVTLTIGPISFPDTELWVGRFVEPRSGAPKVQRLKLESKERRKSNVEPATHKKPRLSSTPARPAGPLPQRPPPPPRPAALTAGPLSNRPPIRPPGRQEVVSMDWSWEPRLIVFQDPMLIQRVNQAAAKNPWLAVLIHKAARQQASREELSQLGRAVGKLGRGEDVGPTPDPPSTTTSSPMPPGPSASSSTSAAQSAAVRLPPPPPTSTPSVASAPTSAPAPVNPPSKAPEADSDDDSDVDMKGPPQEGGGPIPAALEEEISVASHQPQTTEHADSPAAGVVAPAPVPSPSPPGGSGQHVGPEGGPTVLPTPTTQVRTDPQPQLVQTPAINRPLDPGQRAAPVMMPPPPPPRPVYPMPPPFLLVAFRELPTEKYLLPLGSSSFISRVGGDWVTSSPPPSQTSWMAGTASQHPGQPTAETTPITETTPGQTNDTHTPGPPAGPAAVSGRTRARQSVGKPIKAATPPPPKESTPPSVAPTVELPPSSGLDPLPGMEPSPGTVLLSTLIPPTWLQPDWAELGKSIPFGNPAFQVGVSRPPVAVEVKKELLENGESIKPLPKLPSDSNRSLGLPFLLNLGAKDFVPPDAPLQPVTIRLSGIDDKVWHQMKSIISVVEQADVQAIALQETATSARKEESQAPTMDAASLAAALPKSRETWGERRRARFRDLLRRVPSRKFLRMRVDVPPSDILEATSDRFALRPYPLSTKALYSASPPPDDALGVPITLSPELSASKRKGPEPTITFEMPVSLDYLDERVEEGARGLTKKAAKKGEALKADGTPDLRKRGLKRGVAGRLCEGCAREGLKVWRMGPGGPSTRKPHYVYPREDRC